MDTETMPRSNVGPTDALTSAATTAVWRSFDAADINPVFNHPTVFPNVSTPDLDRIDVTALVSDPRNVLRMAASGGVIFCQVEPGIYEVHTAFVKPERGSKGSQIRNAASMSIHGNICLNAYWWMFTHTDCMVLQTKIPAFNRAAIVFAPLLGWRLEFERKSAWPTKDGMVDMSFFCLRYEEWVKKDKHVLETGRSFHRKLDEERARHGAEDEGHPDKECHDRYVGACAEMIYSGQPEKGVVLYNRWARFSGYGQIALISKDPLLVDIGDALLLVADRSFKAIRMKASASGSTICPLH
jgi:hypothetical protein